MYRTQFEKESKGFNLGTIAAMGAGALLVGSAVSGNKPSGGVAAAATAGTIAMMSQAADNWYQIVMSNIQNPNEFQCIKMQVKEPKKNGKGGRRLFPEKMSYSVLGFEGTNASNRNIIDFEINEINNNTFEVTFPKELEPGEYCFFYKGGLGSDSFKEHPFGFDFTVK